MSSVTREQIISVLQEIIPQGSCVLVHSSLKSFGYVDGGADAVIDALSAVCGKAGTVVVPTLTFGHVDESNAFFSVLDTPSTCGIITETLRKRPDALRSAHVFSSAAAIGADAREITRWHEDTPCGPGTPYWKIIEKKGYSLFLGAPMATNSLFHCAEEAVSPAYLCYKTIPSVRVQDRQGKLSLCTYRRYDCAQTGIVRKLEKMESIYRGEGAIVDRQIGGARVLLLPAEHNFRISCAVLQSDPGYLLA